MNSSTVRNRAAASAALASEHGETGSIPAVEERESAEGRARNTIIFSIATGLSRIAGLVREMVSASIYGGGAVASAFTLAFTIPNLLRSLFADMALSAAFVPVFTELLEQKKRREALLLMSTLFWVLLIGLGALCAVAMVTAPLYVPLLTSDALRAEVSNIDSVTVVLSQIMLPTVLLLGLNGLFVGALNAYDHFTIPALSPLVWNVVIIAVNLSLLSSFGPEGSPERIYAQAIGVLVGTIVQLLMVVPVLRRYGIRLVPQIHLRDPRVKQVLVLMVPVALSLGLINFSAAVDAKLGGEVSEEGPRAIEVAFRLYMLPQGVFSVAIVTVLFPVMARAVARADHEALRGLVSSGMAQILVLLVPVGLLFSSPPIAHDIITVLFQRDQWTTSDTDAATVALVWLGASLALNGVSLLLSRTFFALQRPWANTGLALGSLVANVVASLALYRPLGIAGIVLGTFVGNVVLVTLQIRLLRRETGGPLGLAPVLRSLLQVLVASVLAVFAATGVVVVGGVGSEAIGGGTPGSIVTIFYLGLAVVAGAVVYVGIAHEIGLTELERAGGRFVRLGIRLRALGSRLPGASGLARAGRRSAVRRVRHVVVSVMEILALPLRLVSVVAVVLSRVLVGLVPASAVAIAGPAASAGIGTGRAGGAVSRRGTGRARRGATPGGGERPRADRGASRYDEAGTEAPTADDRFTEAPYGDGPHADAPHREERGAGEQAGAGEPGLYDAADDWPTAAHRGGGETLDVPWPAGEVPAGEPSAQELRHEEALRMIAEREAALERIAERERRRREGPPPRGGGRRGRRGR